MRTADLIDTGARPFADRVALWVSVLLVVVLFGLPLFRGLGNTELAGDEPIYAFAVDRMLENGDWLTPRSMPSDTDPFFEKPPLKFWIVAASMRVGLLPQNEFGHRFWDAAFGVAAFLYVFAIGRIMGGALCGVIAVLTLFLHRPLLVEHGLRSDNMEAALLLAYCGGVFHALAWARRGDGWRRWAHPVACGLWFALAFMTKFVAALFLPLVLIATAALVPAWRRRAMADVAPWILSALLSLAVIAPWFLYQGLRDPTFWHIILAEHVVQRMTSYVDPSHLQPWYFYLSNLYVSMEATPLWGSTVLVVGAGLVLLIARAVRSRWDAGILVLLWFLLPFTAISFGSSKLYHYVYPFLPPLALAAGYVVAGAAAERGPVRQALRKITDWIDGTAFIRRIAATSAAQWTLTGLGVIALVVAAARVLHGPLHVQLGEWVVRVGAVERPVAVGILLLLLAGRGRLVTGTLLVPLLLLSMPVSEYRGIVQALDDERAPLRTMAACLVEVQAAGATPGLYAVPRPWRPWGFAYYFREAGWEDRDIADGELAALLSDPAGQRPMLFTERDFAAHVARLAAAPTAAQRETGKRLARVERAALGHGELLLLPGPYASCAYRLVRHESPAPPGTRGARPRARPMTGGRA